MTTLNSRLQLAMLNRKKAQNAFQKGFTLVELMIAIVIVGVLSAVALPNFIGTKSKAEAQSLIGAMAAQAKLCGARMVIGDPSNLPSLDKTTATPAKCDGKAETVIKNTTPFANPDEIGGVRCGNDEVKGIANGTTHATCELTVAKDSGSISGEWK